MGGAVIYSHAICPSAQSELRRVAWRILAALMLFVLFAIDPACSQTSPASASNAPAYRLGATYLAQGWNADETEAWYRISQGTVFMPAEWFAALEEATGNALFAAPDHLARLGFLPDPRSAANPLGLPVGFAIRPLDFPDNDDLQHYQNWKGNWVYLRCLPHG
jgi:hypothetical protein